MRTIHHIPRRLPAVVDHPHAIEMEAMSTILDEHPMIAQRAGQDLVAAGGRADRGRPGMSADQVVRAAIVKQLRQFSYEKLAFHLKDSATYQRFCRIGVDERGFCASVLHDNICTITAETWRLINTIIIRAARDEGIDDGRTLRTDATVTATDIHPPDDAAQLLDVVRVLTRLMVRAAKMGLPIVFSRRTKRAKRRRMDILYAKKKTPRRRAYRDLLKVTEEVIAMAERFACTIATTLDAPVVALRSQILKFIVLGQAVVRQTRCRLFEGIHLPASQKVVSIFEPHTDIIVKGKRDVQFGHKVFLTTGTSGMIFDVFVADGNPADASLTVPLVKRAGDVIEKVPRQVAMDGCFASQANLEELKAEGVQDVCFSKGRGLTVSEMVKSSWVFKKLFRFRAGIEAGISTLKRGFGLDRCTWSGRDGFERYITASVLACNLLIFARARIT